MVSCTPLGIICKVAVREMRAWETFGAISNPVMGQLFCILASSRLPLQPSWEGGSWPKRKLMTCIRQNSWYCSRPTQLDGKWNCGRMIPKLPPYPQLPFLHNWVQSYFSLLVACFLTRRSNSEILGGSRWGFTFVLGWFCSFSLNWSLSAWRPTSLLTTSLNT